jgi:hypothetical protein
MSWGNRIAILYIGFVLMIAALIVRSSMENNDLVATDYYDRELHFQEQINGAEALLNSGQQPSVTYTNEKIIVQLPDSISQAPAGTIVFYRPDNAQLDQEFTLNTSHSEFGRAEFPAGSYNIRLQWKNLGVDYFFETTLYIQ